MIPISFVLACIAFRFRSHGRAIYRDALVNKFCFTLYWVMSGWTMMVHSRRGEDPMGLGIRIVGVVGCVLLAVVGCLLVAVEIWSRKRKRALLAP